MGKMMPSDFSKDRNTGFLSSKAALPITHDFLGFLRLCVAYIQKLLWLSMVFGVKVPKRPASQVASSVPDFLNLTHKFLLSSSELQCSSPPGSLPGPTLVPVILHCPRMELPVPAQFGQG